MTPFARSLAWTALSLTGLVVGCRRTPSPDAVRQAPATPPATGTPTSGAPAGGGPTAGAPTIAALVPDSVRLAPNTISEVTIRGSGFAPTGGNTVTIGPIILRSVSGNGAGTEIVVVVPTRYTTNAEAPPRPLFPGDYPVTVQTGGQTSNSKMLKVLP